MPKLPTKEEIKAGLARAAQKAKAAKDSTKNYVWTTGGLRKDVVKAGNKATDTAVAQAAKIRQRLAKKTQNEGAIVVHGQEQKPQSSSKTALQRAKDSKEQVGNYIYRRTPKTRQAISDAKSFAARKSKAGYDYVASGKLKDDRKAMYLRAKAKATDLRKSAPQKEEDEMNPRPQKGLYVRGAKMADNLMESARTGYLKAKKAMPSVGKKKKGTSQAASRQELGKAAQQVANPPMLEAMKARSQRMRRDSSDDSHKSKSGAGKPPPPPPRRGSSNSWG